MTKLLTAALTVFSLQSYAAVMPDDSVAKQVQDSLNRSAWILGWNEGVWIDSIKMPLSVSEEVKAELLSKTAAEWLDISENGNDKEKQKAVSALGVSYLFGIGVEQSEDFGLLHLKIAADKGRANSAQYLAIAYASGVGKLTEDSVEALKWYKLADKLNGTNENKFDLGAAYLRAAEQATVRKDYKQAVDIHKESLALGHKQAAPYLIALYAAGLGVEKDVDKALQYAKKIDVRTLFNNDADYNKFGDRLSPETLVALINMNAASLHKDIYKRSSVHNEVRLILDKAVREDDPIGTYIAYKAAMEVNDIKYATYAIHKSAEYGIPAAQYELAESFSGYDEYEDKAFDLYKSAAENEYKRAYAQYGLMLYDRQEYKSAMDWLNKALQYESVEYGDRYTPYIGVASDEYLDSVEKLAKMYLDGKGVEQNKDKAVELLDGLIKQFKGRIMITEVQADPSIKRDMPSDKIKERIMYFSNKLSSYMRKYDELIKLKSSIESK